MGQHHALQITNATGCDTVWSAPSTCISLDEVRIPLFATADVAYAIVLTAIVLPG